MKYLNLTLAILILFLFSCGTNSTSQEQAQADAQAEMATSAAGDMNMLSESEKAEGWQLLFDGKSTSGWHNYLKSGVEGWVVENGELKTSGGSGDIVTDESFENFELYVEWNVAPEGNSGIMYLVNESEEDDHTYYTAPEYQIIDDANYPSELTEDQKTGANYALQAPAKLASNPPGTYNASTIILNQGKVEHWLNGEKVVEYELWTPEWEEMVSKTKFKDMPRYGKSKSGKIALQDHGDAISFRNIKIKKL